MRIAVLGIILAATTLAAGEAGATVEVNWPAGVRNACKSATHGFIDFESGRDGQTVRSTIRGTQFTTTDGFDWLHADWRTRRYNGPYPSGSYTSNGNFFTWLGPSQGQGRIDFLDGPASYVSVLTSTASGLVIDAYNRNGALVATSGRAGSNIGTGRLTRVTVESPTGRDIAYVMVHDSGNFWLIDDLCTDAKGVLPFYDAAAETARSAIGAIYTYGAKGYDGGATGTRSFTTASRVLSTGYNYYDATVGGWTPGTGLDCSGLVMWSFNRTFFADATVNWSRCVSDKTCPVFQEGAHGQYDANTDRIAAREVRTGDLIFFDECIGAAGACVRGQDGVMDHVAMFVDSFTYDGKTYNAVHASGFARKTTPAVFDASAGTLTTRLADGRVQALRPAGYGRVSDPRLDAWVVTRSPVHVAITDPNAVRVTRENALFNDLGHTREVSGMYYMVKEIDPGAADDTVAIPRLKTGTYLIDVELKASARPSDVFSLEVRLPDRTITLADRVSVQDQRRKSFAFESTAQGVVEGIRAAVVIKPGDGVAAINPKSSGTTPIAIIGSQSLNVRAIAINTLEIDRDSDRSTSGVRPIRWSMDSDVNGDGYPDMVLHFATPALNSADLLKQCGTVFVTAQYGDGKPVVGASVVYLAGGGGCSR
jgi:hypothetical protein